MLRKPKSKKNPKKKKKSKKKKKTKSKQKSEDDYGAGYELEESRPRTRSAVKTRQRLAEKKKDRAVEERRKKHQEELEKRKRAEALKKYVENDFSPEEDSKKDLKLSKISYESAKQFPTDASGDRIFVDPKRESVLLPISGFLVPFHISRIKSVSKNDKFLRINFITPGSNHIAANKQPTAFEQPKAVYIRGLTYRCSNLNNLNTSYRLIHELRKRSLAQITERLVKESLVKQEALVLNKGRVPRLTDLFARPTVGGRRATGQLEIHKNGFRYRNNKGGKIDILYKNIKHAFYQPAEGELIVLIHLHLRYGIMIGKKKSFDVQFFTHVMEQATSLDGRRNRMFNQALEDEQHERMMRKRLNQQFHNFVKRIEDAVPGLEFDIPYRELGFYGVPHRTTSFMQPTVNCLVQLIDLPFFVLTLDMVEIAHFERVRFHLRNFDLVFVFKDLNKTPAHISSIPVDYLEPLKEWLNECDIKYYEGPNNLNWKNLLKTITADPKHFWETGGWSFLDTTLESDGEQNAEESDEYHCSGQSDDDFYAPQDAEESDDEYEEVDDDDVDDGEDWDEQAKKLAREDAVKERKRGRSPSSSSSGRRRKRRKLR